MLKAKKMEPHIDSMNYSLALDQCGFEVGSTHGDCNDKSQFDFLKLCFTIQHLWNDCLKDESTLSSRPAERNIVIPL